METTRIADELRRSLEGNAWHGPALGELLQDVTADQAARKVPGAHSIWEIALHIENWLKVGIDAVRSKEINDADYVDWPGVDETSEAAWAHVISRLRLRITELCTRVEKLSARDLNLAVVGRQYDLYFLLHGLAQHNAYHGGQIALLKKLAV